MILTVKFRRANSPKCSRAALSRARAASSSFWKNPQNTVFLFLVTLVFHPFPLECLHTPRYRDVRFGRARFRLFSWVVHFLRLDILLSSESPFIWSQGPLRFINSVWNSIVFVVVSLFSLLLRYLLFFWPPIYHLRDIKRSYDSESKVNNSPDLFTTIFMRGFYHG